MEVTTDVVEVVDATQLTIVNAFPVVDVEDFTGDTEGFVTTVVIATNTEQY